jgi:Protein of unknown function (DUF3109)
VIAIENILVSDDVVATQFVCDLNKCKGGCCDDGDAGAPLAGGELDIIADLVEKLGPYLTEEGRKEIERTGLYRYDKEFGWVTPTVDGKICAYGFRDDRGTIKCAFEQAYYDGVIQWKKPISCHLFPIKTKKSRYEEFEMVNYEPREKLCNPACSLGNQLQVPVYVFLKEALIRKFGAEFYKALDALAKEYFSKKKKPALAKK